MFHGLGRDPNVIFGNRRSGNGQLGLDPAIFLGRCFGRQQQIHAGQKGRLGQPLLGRLA